MQWMDGYTFYLLIGVAIGLYLCVLSFPYRQIPGRRYFWMLMLLGSLSVLTTVFELTAESFPVKLGWRNVQQIPLFMSAIVILALVKDYTGRPVDKLRKQVAWLSVPVAVYVLLIVTDPYHHLMRHEVGLETVGNLSGITVKPTLLNMAFIASNQVLCLYAIFVLAISLRNTPKLYYRQHFMLLIGLMLPIGLTLILPALKVHILGFAAMTFFPTTLIIYYALFRYQILSIWPIAKDKIYDNLKNGIVLTDRYHAVVELNLAARKMLAMISEEGQNIAIGQPIERFIADQAELLALYRSNQEAVIEIELQHDILMCYEVSLVPIGNTIKDKHNTGMLLIFSDQSDKKRYERELIHQATIDDLTGIWNRRHFLQEVSEVLDKGCTDVALLLIDIDDFKLINDTYGHQAGDQALIDFSHILQQRFHGSGMVGRVGGEEFAVCIAGHSEVQSQVQAEAFLAELRANLVVLNHAAEITISASIGIAYSTNGAASFEELYQQADAALYKSKQTGKNKVTSSSQSQ